MQDKKCRYEIEILAKDTGVDLATLSTLYLEYFKEMKENINQSILLCSEKAWSNLERVIHNIKGVSISLNILDIYDAALNLDNKLKNKIYDTISSDIKIINRMLISSENEIMKFFHSKDIEF